MAQQARPAVRTRLARVAVCQYRLGFAWFYGRQPELAAAVVMVSENHSTETARSL
jgi:hypothetical protein